MKILVTGMTGFVGRRLAPLLSEADEVVVICHPSSVCSSGKFRILTADLDRLGSLSDELKAFRPDVCIHLAWEGIPDYGFEKSRSNLQQGAALFRLLVEECGCRKIIGLGSCWEYGQSFGVCREDVVLPGRSYFVWAKRSLCDLGMALAEMHGVSFIWLRAFYIYGPGQKGTALLPTIMAALLKGDKPEIRMPANANDFVHVDDVARAVLLAGQKEVPTGIYNLGTGKATPVWQICALLEQAMGKKPDCAAVLKVHGGKAAANFWADTSKTEAFLGWRATIDISAGIEQYLKTAEEGR